MVPNTIRAILKGSVAELYPKEDIVYEHRFLYPTPIDAASSVVMKSHIKECGEMSVIEICTRYVAPPGSINPAMSIMEAVARDLSSPLHILTGETVRATMFELKYKGSPFILNHDGVYPAASLEIFNKLYPRVIAHLDVNIVNDILDKERERGLTDILEGLNARNVIIQPTGKLYERSGQDVPWEYDDLKDICTKLEKKFPCAEVALPKLDKLPKKRQFSPGGVHKYLSYFASTLERVYRNGEITFKGLSKNTISRGEIDRTRNDLDILSSHYFECAATPPDVLILALVSAVIGGNQSFAYKMLFSKFPARDCLTAQPIPKSANPIYDIFYLDGIRKPTGLQPNMLITYDKDLAGFWAQVSAPYDFDARLPMISLHGGALPNLTKLLDRHPDLDQMFRITER